MQEKLTGKERTALLYLAALKRKKVLRQLLLS